MFYGYFTGCKCIEDVKRKYRELAKKLHPDCNPGTDTTAAFKQMQQEYTEAFNRYKNIHATAGSDSDTDPEARETYTKETADSQTAEEYADMINQLIHLHGITIEIIGSWLWITGDTKQHKDILKTLGFRWASKKKAWYYHKEAWHHRSSGKDMDGIRAKWGSQTVKEAEKEKAIA